MNIEKIKDFVIEKKFYGIAIIVMVIAVIFFKHNDQQKADNSALLGAKTEMSQSSFKNKSESTEIQKSTSDQPKTVTCDISGAVKHEGVYTLKNGHAFKN